LTAAACQAKPEQFLLTPAESECSDGDPAAAADDGECSDGDPAAAADDDECSDGDPAAAANAESGLMFQKFAANPGDSRPAEPLAAQQARIERCAEEWALRNGYEFETKEDLDKCVKFVLSCT
jgi:hypothetical protein